MLTCIYIHIYNGTECIQLDRILQLFFIWGPITMHQNNDGFPLCDYVLAILNICYFLKTNKFLIKQCRTLS